MSRFLLIIICCLAVGCTKNEPYSNPYYTEEQVHILDALCNKSWWLNDNKPYYGRCKFVTQNKVPFNATNINDPQQIISVDGVYIYISVILRDYTYFYFKLLSETEIEFFYIKENSDSGELEEILNNIPPYYSSYKESFDIFDDENLGRKMLRFGSRLWYNE